MSGTDTGGGPPRRRRGRPSTASAGEAIPAEVQREKERFRAATEWLTEGAFTLADLAKRFGVGLNHLSRIRSAGDPRRPQPGWEAVVAELAAEAAGAARERAVELDSLASNLRRRPLTVALPAWLEKPGR